MTDSDFLQLIRKKNVAVLRYEIAKLTAASTQHERTTLAIESARLGCLVGQAKLIRSIRDGI